MGQHPDPDPDKDEDDLEELGTPVYQGNGLSVRALTAEELQRFLDAHAGQPAQLLGSGWAALDPPGHPLGFPGPLRSRACATRTPAGARPSHRQPGQPRPLRPGRTTGGAAPPSWPPGPAAWPGGRRWSPPPASPPARSPPRPACPGPGWSAWRSPRWSAGGCGSAPPSRPAPGSAAPKASGTPPGCWTASAATATWSSTTWPCPARPPTSITWSIGPSGRVRHRLQAVDRQRPPGRRRAGLAQPLPPGPHPGHRPLGSRDARPPARHPCRPRWCASTAPTSKAAACTPRAWRSSPPPCSAARSAMTGCCRTPTSSCSPPPPGPACARPPDRAEPASATGQQAAG